MESRERRIPEKVGEITEVLRVKDDYVVLRRWSESQDTENRNLDLHHHWLLDPFLSENETTGFDVGTSVDLRHQGPP